ncbi:PAS domain S-box protein, partial [Candidatus Binatia bacterium]|nr:PAS domain S-box protein [Candidatus Binatia bacterium]
MDLAKHHGVREYAIGVAAAVCAVLVRVPLDPLLGPGSVPFITFFPAVVLAAILGGVRGGLTTAFSGALLAWFLILPPKFSFAEGDHFLPALAAFLIAATLIAGMGGSLRASRDRARRAEALARQEKDRLRVTVASIGDGLIVSDADGRVTFLNAVAERLTGWTSAEAAGRPLADVFRIVAEDTRQPATNPAERALREGRIVGLANHTLLLARDGSERPIDDSAAPIVTGDGTIEGCVLVFRDVSERRAAEQARHLADRRKDEFLATLAHELRNPLAPIRSSIELLGRAGGDPRVVASALRTMDRQVSHLVRLVDDLLDISRVTHDRLQLETARVTLADVLEPALEACRPLVEEAGHELRVDVPEEPIWLEADAIRLAQVFTNLVGNAVKYTPRAGRITVSVRRDGDDVRIVVRDTGIGFPPDAAPRLFELFSQAGPRPSHVHGGLGIGLSLVRRLVEMHGGDVSASSDGPGRGSAFVVRLPVVTAPDATEITATVAATPTGAQPAREAQSAGPDDGGSNGALRDGTAADGTSRTAARRILVVDDNRDAAES